jgi:hypothetical protein
MRSCRVDVQFESSATGSVKISPLRYEQADRERAGL